MQQRQSLHGKANNLLQHSREDDANQGSAILVLELPSDVEAEAGVPGGNGQLDVVSVLGANGQGAGGFNVSGLTSLSVGDGERDGDSGDDSVDDGVDGGGSIRSFREEARGLGASVNVDGSNFGLGSAILKRRGSAGDGQKAKEDGDGGRHDFNLRQTFC